MMIMIKVIMTYEHDDDDCIESKMLMVMINICNDNDYLEQKMKETNRTQLSHPKGS